MSMQKTACLKKLLLEKLKHVITIQNNLDSSGKSCGFSHTVHSISAKAKMAFTEVLTEISYRSKKACNRNKWL